MEKNTGGVVLENTELNERVAALEANEHTIFHQIDEMRSEIKDLRHLTAAVEKLAAGQGVANQKLDSIGRRLLRVENEPVDDFKHYKRLIVGCLLTTTLSAVLAAIIATFLH